MLAQQLVNGVMQGAVYALFALGFTLMFGVLRVINLTYGFYVSAGAFVALALTERAELGIWTALPLAALATGIMAVALDWLLLTRLRRAHAPELASLMVTLGAVLALYGALSAWLGTDIRRLPARLEGQGFVVLGLHVSVAQVAILVVTAALVAALVTLLRATRLGLAIRAMAEQPEAAALMGIDTARLAALVSFISGTLAGAAGVLIGFAFNAIQPYMGEAMMLRGFVVVIAGGLGDVGGAVIAGLALGVIEALTAAYFASAMKEAVGFVVLVLVLWTRPAGLFGRTAARRA